MTRQDDDRLFPLPGDDPAGNAADDNHPEIPNDAPPSGQDTQPDAPIADGDENNGYTRQSRAWDDGEESVRTARQVKNRYQAMEDEDEAEWRRARPQGDNATSSGRLFVSSESQRQQDQHRRDKQAPRRAERRRAQKERRREERLQERKARTASPDEKRRFIRRMAGLGLCAVLFCCVAVMVIANFVDIPLLQAPKRAVTAVITPMQEGFSGVTDAIAAYLRTLKIRGNIEYEYEQLLIKLDDLASEAAMAEEYKRQVNDLYDLMDEINRNTELNPLAANVIGHDTGNYFSVLTLNVGKNQGVRDYMAVVYAGGLVGYTYEVEENTCSVRCIIDSDATVFGMVQSTRDQGAVKGTLGIDGQARCRMYYLPENTLPRPGDIVVTSGVGMEFPKGIPIGTVRESTRGMDENKSYVVVEPMVDFQHLEYVVVYRYQPAYAESAQDRSAGVQTTLEPIASIRPQPTFQVGIDTGFTTATPGDDVTPTPTPSPSPAPSDPNAQTPTPDPNATPTPENLTYQAPDNLGGTATPVPTFTPTPSPEPTATFNPDELTVEDEE